jgi:DNA polymerase-3 subunit delta'
MAVRLAAALLCPKARTTLGGCGRCEDCRLVQSETHPDLLLLGPERLLVAEELKREIGIKNARELIRLLSLSPWQSGRKAAIIDGADLLSVEAQSALLKILEDPPGTSVIILVTSSAEALLPTIRSRCIPLGFTTLADTALLPLLAGLPALRRDEILTLAEGRPGLAVRLMEDKELAGTLKAASAERAAVISATLADQFAFSERMSREPEALAAFLAALMRSFERELLVSLAEPAGGRVTRLADFLMILLDRFSLARTTTVNRRLIADSVFIALPPRPAAAP